jgi:hypothetical protein
MKFTFSVGNNEKHTINFDFNQLWGKLIVKVDNKDIIDTIQMWKTPFSTKEPISFEVGDKEKHKIKIVKNASPIFAGFLPCKYEVYIDENLFNTYSGY